jgi:manganese/zinc/iron transport system substrate-binding protein
MKAVESVRDSLIKFDPAHKSEYEKRATTYLAELKELHQYAKTQLATVPKAQRVLVTAHDAFGYFGRAYDVEVEGLQGISTASEYSVKDVQRLVKMLSERRIKAVFVESSVPRRSVEAVVQGCRARGHEVKIGGELFSDAMGKAGTPEGTYIGMVRHNVDLIAKSLK